jgi:RHS repeat-associated protein
MPTATIRTATCSLSYDAENRLAQISGGAGASFVYDGDGQRVRRDTDTDFVLYVGSHYEARFGEQDMPEDFDGDCVITIVDIMLVASRWGTSCDNPDPDNNPDTPNYDPLYDFDGDCEITVADIMRVAARWRKTCQQLAETVKYYWLGGRRVAMRRVPEDQPETLYYLFTDHLGSTSVAYDTDSGAWVTQRYYPWGTIRPGGGNLLPTDYTFTGQRWDEAVELMDYKARWYDPALGRFIQPDPLVPEPGNPQALNRYAYGLNNPVRYRDPSGYWVETAWDIANILWDIYEVRRDPSLLNIGALVVDVGTAILPLVPAGAGLIVRGGKAAKVGVEVATHADEMADVAKVLAHADEVGKSLRVADKLADIPGFGRLVSRLKHPFWFVRVGAEFEAERAAYYAERGLLEGIEVYENIGGKKAYYDLLLKGGIVVETKSWTGWARWSEATQRARLRDLVEQLDKYMSSGKQVILDWKGELPPEVYKRLQPLIERGLQINPGL